jgi:DNA-binding NarL/FixJ family response regulator
MSELSTNTHFDHSIQPLPENVVVPTNPTSMDTADQGSNGRRSPDGSPNGSDLIGDLSPRQSEVFHWICEGKRDREIATILGISYRTVTVHVRAILAKLGVENRTCAAMLSKERTNHQNHTDLPDNNGSK